MFKRLLTIICALLITSCGSEDVSSKDTLRVGVSAEPVTLYPYGSNDNPSASVHVNIFDRLLEKDNDGGFHPSLATEWEMISPTQLKVTLRTNAMFHNGELLTPSDVKYSLERAIASPEIRNIANPIKSVEILDGETVIVHLHTPFAPILSHLAHSVMAILNQKAAEEAGEDIDQKPVGTGAYQLAEWNRGQSVIVKVFPEYWGDVPKIPNIEFRVIPEAASRTIALETGDVDIAYDVDAVDRERIMGNSKLQLIEEPVARIEYLGFNIGKGRNPIWKDARVREAVALAIDREGIINSVLFGAGTPADSIIYKSVVGHYDGITARKQDIAKAKALLAEAGIPAGTKVSLWTSDGPRQKTAEIIQANLREIGLDMSIEVLEWARFLDGTGKGEHDTLLLSWGTITGDADYGIYNLVHTGASGGSGNRSFYSNPVVDSLLDSARKEIDPVKRDELYKQVQITLDQELPIYPIYYKLANVGAAGYVKGFVFHVTESHRLNTVHF